MASCVDRAGNTLLHSAVRSRRGSAASTAILLVDLGAEVDARNRVGSLQYLFFPLFSSFSIST